MPSFKVKIKKGKMRCPVCDQMIQGKLAKAGKYVVARNYECANPVCGYAYFSEEARANEYFGQIVIAVNFDYLSFKPDMSEIQKSLNKHRKRRNQLLRETRAIMNDNDCKLIFECFRSPNSNKLGLSRTFFDWLKARRKQFPQHLKSIAERIERYEDQQKNKNSLLDEGEQNRSDAPGS